MKVAKLVTVSFITRVIVDKHASEEEILNAAKSGFQAKLDNNELNENLEEIKDDTECPYLEYEENCARCRGTDEYCPICGTKIKAN